MVLHYSLRLDKASKRTGMVPVLATVYFNGKRVRSIISGVKVLPNDWNQERERIIPPTRGRQNNHREYNSRLDDIQSKISSYSSKCFLERVDPDPKLVTSILKGTDHVSEVTAERPELLTSYRRYIDQNISHRAKRTITGYNTTYNLLKEFVEYSAVKTTLDEIDLDFFDQLRNYCFEEKGYKNNYFAKIINNLKSFMRWAKDRNMHTNTSYERFTQREEEVEVVYLTMTQLLHLHNFKFESDRLSRARHVYTFACFSGLRYSDISNLKTSDIHDEFLRINVQKTRDKDQEIPLNKFSKEILSIYKKTRYYPLPVISSQKQNQYIKEACKVAGLDSPITITRYSGKEKIETVKPLYEALTMHTARKTFVTNSLILGMNPMVVRSITGHKSDSAFRRYVSVASSEKRKAMKHFYDEL